MRRLVGHGPAKYPTGTRLGTSEGQGWKGLLAERWRNPEGDLGAVQVRDTEIIVMLQGRLLVRRRGDGQVQHCNAVPGTIWLCPAGVYEDMIHLYGEVRESIHLFLPAVPLAETALREINVDPARVSLRYEGGFRDPLIEQIARNIHAEMLDPAPAGKMLVETLASALGAHVLRNHSNLESASVSLPTARGALDPRRLQRVKDLIETNPGADLTIEALAKEACLSPFHFARAFKAATGMAPHRYVTDRRIEKAKFWISEGRRPLAEIAYLCGFSSQPPSRSGSSDLSEPPRGHTERLPLITEGRDRHPHGTRAGRGTADLRSASRGSAKRASGTLCHANRACRNLCRAP